MQCERPDIQTLVSLRNHEGDAEDNVMQLRIKFIFATNLAILLSHYSLFITVKNIAKLNPDHSDKFEIKI